MRERARDKGRLEDIIEYSGNVTMLIEGYSLETLKARPLMSLSWPDDTATLRLQFPFLP